ncbi:MAG: aminoacyl-tRNA hydrolase [Rickettsiales bacterium]|nr:aminoacyl-tRNA hydrolase [Rickettsiales bacterium]
MLAVGLGNIGNEYAKTRHNLGFMAIDAIREKYGFPDWKERPKYLFSKSKIGGRDVMLVKPKTYMNLSGGAVLAAATACKIPPDGTVVIHDDLDLAPARVKIKLGGGNAGHNGLRDIDAKIGRGYWRIRIGIGHPRDSAPAMDVADYVLARPPKDEAVALAAAIEKIADRFEAVAGGDFSMPL